MTTLNIPNAPQTTDAGLTAPPKADEKVSAPAEKKVIDLTRKNTVTDATKGSSPSEWSVKPYNDGISASHPTGEMFVGSIAEFNKHLAK